VSGGCLSNQTSISATWLLLIFPIAHSVQRLHAYTLSYCKDHGTGHDVSDIDSVARPLAVFAKEEDQGQSGGWCSGATRVT
jgi:hypothetical protein